MLVVLIRNDPRLINSLAIFKHTFNFHCLWRRPFLIKCFYFITLTFYTRVKTLVIIILFLGPFGSYCVYWWWLKIQSIGFDWRLATLILCTCVRSLVTTHRSLASSFTEVCLHTYISYIFTYTRWEIFVLKLYYWSFLSFLCGCICASCLALILLH